MSVILDFQNMYKDHNRGLSFISCFPHFTFSNYVCTVKIQKFTLMPHSSWNFRLGHIGFPQNDRLSSCTPQDTESPNPLSHQVVHRNRFLVRLYSWWPRRFHMSASSTMTSHSIWWFLHSEAKMMGLGKIPSVWNGPFHSLLGGTEPPCDLLQYSYSWILGSGKVVLPFPFSSFSLLSLLFLGHLLLCLQMLCLPYFTPCCLPSKTFRNREEKIKNRKLFIRERPRSGMVHSASIPLARN